MGLPQKSKISIGTLKKGASNSISDVSGVTVGHSTIRSGDIHTGVTVILPHQKNLFQEKVLAGFCVLNGFGKTAGLVQLQELGTIETPIALTNTLSVGTVWEELAKVMIEQNPEIGVTTGTVNPLVAECNDGRLNDIRGFHVKGSHLREALTNASNIFEEGDIGAGSGMVCLGFKGGIGSSSRQISVANKTWTLGSLVLSNFGSKGNLTVNGQKIHPEIPLSHGDDKDQGSIIMVLATDLPLSSRQLNRIAMRSSVGLGRTGSYMGNGSGDICIAFSTSNLVPHERPHEFLSMQFLHDDDLDAVFQGVSEVVEESILSSLWHAQATTGIRGFFAPSFQDWWNKNQI